MTKKHTKNFYVYDVDGSGYVEEADLQRWAKNLAQLRDWQPGTLEFENILAKFKDIWTNFWQPADINDDGKVSLQEYLKVVEVSVDNFPNSREMQESHTAKANTIFSILDADNDGTISQSEYIQFCRAIGLDEATAKSAFIKLDGDGKGYISREEYLQRSQDFHVSNDPDALGNWLYGSYEI
ncbi:MAG: hypothetical protein F6K08_33845 [Okeania sp. SIO1H6]|nr:hypothetical protein [Okeania sp. SIO2B9]NET17454.1 hypothetical protein [Okeania sp. SIO1H6]